MRASVALVYELVRDLRAADAVEAGHRAVALRWLAGTDDVFRRVKPATPPRHLVSYVVPVDRTDGSVLLVDHRNASLWLPPGGHVEPDEHPAGAARREAGEELGPAAGRAPLDERPAFLTVTRTVGRDAGHTDVSLWFILHLDRRHRLQVDQGEFRDARWWSPAQVAAADRSRFDPHLGRFLAKLAGRPGPERAGR